MKMSILDKVEQKNFDLEKDGHESTVEKYATIPIDRIEISSNIRTEYDEESINALAFSFKNNGQLVPIRVYENKNKYTIIFGHRRYLAAKVIDPDTDKPVLNELKCIITAKPDNLDMIYLQAIENEHSVNISSTDREKYIKLLNNKYNQPFPEIAKRIGKRLSWVNQALNALKFEDEYKKKFFENSDDMYLRNNIVINNATDEEIRQAVSLIVKNHGDLEKKNINKKGSRSVKIAKNHFLEENAE